VKIELLNTIKKLLKSLPSFNSVDIAMVDHTYTEVQNIQKRVWKFHL